MRCVGAANPPCARCLKRDRECVVRLPNRHQRHIQRSTIPVDRLNHTAVSSRRSPAASPSSTSPIPPPTVNINSYHPPDWPSPKQGSLPSTHPILPSIFSTSPITIATVRTSESDNPHTNASISSTQLEPDQISDSLIIDLVEFFIQRLLFYVPVLALEPLDDIDSLITRRRPLAHAMAFVASTFTLGYTAARQYLLPCILKILEEANSDMNCNEEDNWTLLQALAVLYAYPRVTAVSRHVEKQINPWAVKSAIETRAMQVSLHESVENLNNLIKCHEPEIMSSHAYRRTFYWLWLFVKSRHHSILTRTPPTIRNDSTVASAIDLLLSLDYRPSVWRIAAETALHRVWDRAASVHKGLAEWWCVPPNTKDIGSLLELLENAETLLQDWEETWLQPSQFSTPSAIDPNNLDVSILGNSLTTFMGILTRFIILSFAAHVVSHQLAAKRGSSTISSTTAQTPELRNFLNCVLKSSEAASKCCDSIIDLKPAAREFLRYTPDYGFTMISLCCLHLVYAYNMFPDNLTLKNYLLKVEQVAHLLMELNAGSNTCPKTYGEYVLFDLRQKVQKVNATFAESNFTDDEVTNGLRLDYTSNYQDLSLNACADRNQLEPLLFHFGLATEHVPVINDLNYECNSFLQNSGFPDLLDMYPDFPLESSQHRL
ncbi:hypothetical protein BGW36DRAFT_355717 [Talaromyces proteolyticus]|uniref:Transcription factor domain-containing protein n=1 Tax=Talaromyces proteolyticus TaxID=1131652 RepID=A0AAD4KWE8_9EURO|nr:uncharacterized protein BGW36DRAFT_355717 [Talaromyces proteolyticus]KAH8701560.1 hypothetical protein BGW36DRAFT_355717 [Talaromyces proteolyticus]